MSTVLVIYLIVNVKPMLVSVNTVPFHKIKLTVIHVSYCHIKSFAVITKMWFRIEKYRFRQINLIVDHGTISVFRFETRWFVKSDLKFELLSQTIFKIITDRDKKRG